ncbi:MAG TPA: serine dehydratase beta chain, partial [Woeseiaceae bacterium]|nr:serine dehydratase beta chain [Woeseiaceae bacterium]
MAISVFDLFKIGIGPSSSHTVGPMKAAGQFVSRLHEADAFERVARVQVELYGSLGATGRGHGSDKAVILGLEGERPEHVAVESIAERVDAVRENGILQLGGEREIGFAHRDDLLFDRRQKL